MKYLALLLLFVYSCGEPPILEPGTYDVVRTIIRDSILPTGDKDKQEWVFTSDTVQLFRGMSKHKFVEDSGTLVVDEDDFYMEIIPRIDRTSFDGEWTNLDFNISADVRGRIQ